MTALREAGFDERQAEGVVATVRDSVAEGVATRADVARLETRMCIGMLTAVALVKLLP